MDWIIVILGLIIVGLCFYIDIIKDNRPQNIKLIENDNKFLRDQLKSMHLVSDAYILILETQRKERNRFKKEIEELEQKLVDIRKEKEHNENS